MNVFIVCAQAEPKSFDLKSAAGMNHETHENKGCNACFASIPTFTLRVK